MNVLSLFDGISCGRLAAERAGLKVDNYYASEVDKYATIISQKNYPSIIRLGDICNWESWDIDWSSINLVMGGFPCQSWSAVGNREGTGDHRGALFLIMLQVLRHVLKHNKQAKFLFENVYSMSTKDKLYLTKKIGAVLGRCSTFLLDSATVSAQRRKRLYWVNDDPAPTPEDKGIMLKDILEDSPDPKYTISARALAGHRDISRAGNFRFKPHYDLNVKASTLTSGSNGRRVDNYIVMSHEDEVRKLTPLEWERLQTLPDGYTEGVSNTQRYKAIGNGWTVDIIAHILGHLFRDSATT